MTIIHRHQYRPALSGCQPELRHEHCAGLPVRGGRIHQGTRIGAAKGETELIEEVNRIIGEVREEGLYDQWYEQYTEYARSWAFSNQGKR